MIERAAPLVQERIQTLAEGAAMVAFLLVDEIDVEEKARAKHLDEAGLAVLAASVEALSAVDEWSIVAIEAALRERLIEQLELKPRLAFGPIRVAVTGSAVSPPLFESLELLGRDVTLARLRAATDQADPSA